MLYRLIALFDYKRHYHRQTSGLKTVPMGILARVVEKGEIPTLDLGKAADIPPATLIGILDDLEAKGLIERIRSKADKRVVLVSATPAGAASVARRNDEERRFQENIVGGLDESECRGLSALLIKLLDGIGEDSDLFKE